MNSAFAPEQSQNLCLNVKPKTDKSLNLSLFSFFSPIQKVYTAEMTLQSAPKSCHASGGGLQGISAQHEERFTALPEGTYVPTKAEPH
jgi:hypothetical protein